MDNIRKSKRNGVFTILKSDFPWEVWADYCDMLDIDSREADFVEVYPRIIIHSKRGGLIYNVLYAKENQLELLENKKYEEIDFKTAMENIRSGAKVYAKYDGKFVICDYKVLYHGLVITFHSLGLETSEVVKTLKNFELLDYAYYEEA